MRHFSLRSASIQLRTSLGKSDVSWPVIHHRSLRLRDPPPPTEFQLTSDHGTLSEARSRLDRSRFSRPNTHFLAFFKIYKKIIFSRANLANFCEKKCKSLQFFDILGQCCFFFFFARTCFKGNPEKTKRNKKILAYLVAGRKSSFLCVDS